MRFYLPSLCWCLTKEEDEREFEVLVQCTESEYCFNLLKNFCVALLRLHPLPQLLPWYFLASGIEKERGRNGFGIFSPRFRIYHIFFVSGINVLHLSWYIPRECSGEIYNRSLRMMWRRAASE